MNKINLNKLSKSELIEMLLKQQKPKKVDAKQKKKVVYNHENLFDEDPFPDYVVTNDPFERTMSKVNRRNKKIDKKSALLDVEYTKVVKNDKEIYRYPMREASLDQYRREELKSADDKNKRFKSFVKLFKKRISGLRQKKQTMSMTIDARIVHSLRGVGETVTDHTYGPFTVKMPVNLSIPDTYKFALSTLMNSNITLLSGESITDIGFQLVNLDKKRPFKHSMGKLKLESYLLNKQRPIKSHGVNTCVVDYIWDQVCGKKGFKTYTYEKLKNKIYNFVPEEKEGMINTEELINWAYKCHNNVSIHAFDSRYRKFITHIKQHPDVSLVYIVKDHHCYPITDEKLKIVASKANQGGCDDLLKYMTDMKWTRRHENVTQINQLMTCRIKKENHIIVLPEGVRMRDAISLYSTNKNLYVEYLHWNNYGVLDGFIDHNKNMYLLNDEYDTRKQICDRLFNMYKTHDFKWTNQSYTSIAMSLFAQQCGYIPESSYNVHTRQMLDEYYPRALQWCTTDDIPDDVVSIDISKCYPSILLNNNHEIPIYTIHDVIEPFNCKTDLSKCGEFYIDETILFNYGNPIKIKAGFYSSNLVSYLVDVLHMSTSQIKYKITTKKALKPDTFSKFMKYIFDELPEGEAKKIANSFIGQLGMKYNKTNQGFTCTEYDTACCCWTSAMAEGKNVTVEHFDGIYLVREQMIDRKFSDHMSIN